MTVALATLMILVGLVAAIADMIYPDDRKKENLFWPVLWCSAVAPGVMLLCRYLLWLNGGKTPTDYASVLLFFIGIVLAYMTVRSLFNALRLRRGLSRKDKALLWLKPVVWIIYVLPLPVFLVDLNRPPYLGDLTVEGNAAIDWLEQYRNTLETAALASSSLLCACMSVFIVMYLFWPERTPSVR